MLGLRFGLCRPQVGVVSSAERLWKVLPGRIQGIARNNPPLGAGALDDGDEKSTLAACGAGDGIRTGDILLGRQEVGGDIEGSDGNSVATPLPKSWRGQFAVSMLQLPSSTLRQVKLWAQSSCSARATRATRGHCAWQPLAPSRSPSDMRNETGRLPAVHCGAVADRDAYGLSPLEINCRHFVAILGDKGCYVK